MLCVVTYDSGSALIDEYPWNAEVIGVDQDPLGKQARIVRQSDKELVLAKPLEDGSLPAGEVTRRTTYAVSPSCFSP